MGFVVSGLSALPFLDLYDLPETELAARGVRRYRVDAAPGFPDRIEMREGRPGETMLLLNHLCQPANSPYRASHAIFVREGATETWRGERNELPEVMRQRLLSLRAFDAAGMMLEADVAQGAEVAPAIERLLEDPAVAYLHAHNAKQGCYSGRVDRG